MRRVSPSKTFFSSMTIVISLKLTCCCVNRSTFDFDTKRSHEFFSRIGCVLLKLGAQKTGQQHGGTACPRARIVFEALEIRLYPAACCDWFGRLGRAVYCCSCVCSAPCCAAFRCGGLFCFVLWLSAVTMHMCRLIA